MDFNADEISVLVHIMYRYIIIIFIQKKTFWRRCFFSSLNLNPTTWYQKSIAICNEKTDVDLWKAITARIVPVRGWMGIAARGAPPRDWWLVKGNSTTYVLYLHEADNDYGNLWWTRAQRGRRSFLRPLCYPLYWNDCSMRRMSGVFSALPGLFPEGSGGAGPPQ